MSIELGERIGDGKYLIAPERRGDLYVYEKPDPSKRYVIASDASQGGQLGDWSAACVLETGSCDLVAVMHGKRDPQPWGRTCAALAWYYNSALLGFETHPSQHGLSACLAARDIGYPLLYRRAQLSTTHNRITEELGWASTVKTRPLMIDAVREAISARFKVPHAQLLAELVTARYGAADDLFFDGHDDLFVSYGIALCIRRHAVIHGMGTKEPERAGDWTDRWWKHRKRALEQGDATVPDNLPGMYDGS